MDLAEALNVRTAKGTAVADMTEKMLRKVIELRRLYQPHVVKAAEFVLVEQMKACRKMINLVNEGESQFSMTANYPDFNNIKLCELQARILEIECEIEAKRQDIPKTIEY